MFENCLVVYIYLSEFSKVSSKRMKMMSNLTSLTEELNIPRAYIRELDKSDKFLVAAHHCWLRLV